MTSFTLGIIEITAGMSVLVILLAVLMRIVGKKFTAKCRYVLWVLVILRLAVPISISVLPALIEIPLDDNKLPAGVFVVPSDTLSPVTDTDFFGSAASPTDFAVHTVHNSDVFPPKTPDMTSPVQAITPTVTPSITPADTDANVASVPTHTSAGIYKQILAFFSAEIGLRIVSTVYFATAALFVLWNLTSYMICTRRVMKRSTEPDKSVYDILSQLCRKYGVKHVPEIRVYDGIGSPVAFGLFRRRIVLPNIGLDDASLCGTLSHEIVHCKRGDLYIKFFMLIARSLHWFNPLVHFAAVRCETEMELSCDETVLSGCSNEDRIAYGEMMLDVIKRCRCRRSVLTTHFNPKKHAVKARLLNILNGCGKRQGKALIASCLVLCVLAGTVFACRLPDNVTGDPQNETYNGDDEADIPIPPSVGDKTTPDDPFGTEIIEPITPPYGDTSEPAVGGDENTLGQDESELNDHSDGDRFIKYGEDGSVERVAEYDKHGRLVTDSYYSDGVLSYEYRYNSDGKIENIQKYDIDGSILSVERYKYNYNGQLEKKTSIGKYVGNDVTEYEYYSDGTLKLTTKYDQNISISTPKERYFYDENGRLTQTEMYFSDGYLKNSSKYEYYTDGTLKLIERYDQGSYARYFRDEKGKLTKAEKYLADGSVESVSKYEYNADGKLITSAIIGPRIDQVVSKYEYYENGATKTYTQYGESDVPHSKKYYEYYENGAIKTCTEYVLDDVIYLKMYYAENGLMYKKVTYNADGSINQVIEYEYDETDRVSGGKIKDYSGVDVVKFEYHSNGVASKEVHYGSDSIADMIIYYDEAYREVRREYFSSDGKLTEWTDFDRHDDWSIDCATYMVRSDGSSYLYEKSFWKDCDTIASLTQYGEDGSSIVTLFDEDGTPVSSASYDANGNFTGTITPQS